MDQMTLFAPSYRYIIDTSSILSQKPTEPHRRQVYKSLWNKIDDYIRRGVIVTCSEVAEEIKDKSIKEWLHAQRCCILDIDTEIQLTVRKIVSENPKMIEFTNGKGTSSGDAFLIATAMKYGLIIISEENQDKPTKIPQISKSYGIESVNITGLCDKEHWEF